MEYSLKNLEIGSVVVLAVFTLILTLRRSRYAAIRAIPGPPSSSWLYGNMRELLLSYEYGQHEFQWQAKYGPVYRIKGCFGQDRLMVSDPVTIRHVLGDVKTFPRSPGQQQIVRSLIGEGSLFYVNSTDHQRIRAVMNPAFSAANVRELPPMFQKIARKLSDQWKEFCTHQSVMDVNPSLHRATLDAISESILGIELNTLDNDDSELGRSHHNIVAMSGIRSKTAILADAIVYWLPTPLLRLALQAPSAALNQLSRNRNLTGRLATELIESKSDAFKQGMEPEKDLLSLLVKANATINPSKRMLLSEMRDQVPSIMIAGQDTTANTVGWALYHLAKDVSMQDKLREEIQATHTAVRERGDSELSYGDVEGMPYLSAFMKEALRFYAGLPMSEREVATDAVLPLSEPITTLTGERITEIPVKKGQSVVVAAAAYHQLASVWGEDANEFKASRWMDSDRAMKAGGALGPYGGNLLTFLGGQKTCIGWRLALIEIQVFLIELLPKFSFALPKDSTVRKGVSLTLIPITGEGHGTQGLPLQITSLE